MKKINYFKFYILSLLAAVCVFYVCSFAQSPTQQDATKKEGKSAASGSQQIAQVLPQAAIAPKVEADQPVASQKPGVAEETPLASNTVTLDFKDADIQNVLKIISYKSGVNIVTTPDVIGNVTIRLVDVPWEKALDVVLRNYGFGYERQGNIIMVAPIDKLTNQKKQEVELAQVQPMVTEVFNLKYIDALDAKKALEPQLSARGKITVLEMSGQAGWEFSSVSKGEGLTKAKKVAESGVKRSKILIVSDVPPVLEKIKEVIEQIDLRPKQVSIETRIMEVSNDKLKDIGVNWGTGSGGAESSTITMTPTAKKNGIDLTQLGAHAFGALGYNPSIFSPAESGMDTANTGLKLIFKKLTGAQFEMVLHALEEDINSNTLSAPRITALNNQEATILIGTKYPILKVDTTGGAAAVVTQSLDYYQDVGIQLNVVPQIGSNDFINMVVHPAISSITTSDSAITTAKYPIIEIREAETRVLVKDGDTIVMGGLMKDIKKKEKIGIPYLCDIPLIGFLFGRDTDVVKKVDLLIFITTRILKESDYDPGEIAKLEERLDRGPLAEDKNKKKKNKKNKKKNNNN